MTYVYDLPGTTPRLVLTAPGEAQLCVSVPLDVYLACVDLASVNPEILRTIIMQALRQVCCLAEEGATP